MKLNPSSRKRVLTVFGTRPEIIKIAPVVAAMAQQEHDWHHILVSTSQHTDLLRPFVTEFGLTLNHDLNVMTAAQSPQQVLARVLNTLGPVIQEERPDIILVQGDTTTALAASICGFYSKTPVGHIEAGLRTGNPDSPFPEEAHRKMIGQIASVHFAATNRNVENLVAEGIPKDRIHLTGNTVVDALLRIRQQTSMSSVLCELLTALRGKRIIAVTTHRRENFGEAMQSHLRALRKVVEKYPDVVVVLPVHPNPEVRRVVDRCFAGATGIYCIDPLPYGDFIHLLDNSWLIASDSGGVQEEAPTLRKPLLILRDTTERPEVIDCGIGRLIGKCGDQLQSAIESAVTDDTWFRQVRDATNPFGNGDAGNRIVSAIDAFLASVGE